MEKKCSRCLLNKDVSDFYKQTSSKDGKMSRCKKCCAEYNKEWQLKNPERARERWRIAEKKSRNLGRDRARKYGLTEDQLNLLLAKHSRCEICNRSFDEIASHVDHDHATGIVRGVLCSNCNTGIGNLRDDIVLVKKALEYLLKYAPIAQPG